MALSANSKVEARPAVKPKASIQVVNAATIYSGGAVALCGPDHATAGNQGRTKPWASLASEIPFGFKILDQVLGNTSPGAGAQIPEAEIDMGARIYEALTVTGLTGDRTDHGKLVYMSDDATWTLTRPAAGIPMGIVVRSTSATTADVYMFSAETLLAIALAGCGSYTMCIGAITVATAAATYLLGTNSTGITMPHHGKFTSVYAICMRANTDVDVSIDANLKINDVATTGGVVQLRFNDAFAAVKAGTAITGNNVFHEGDKVQVGDTVNTAGTASDPGQYTMYATVQTLPGL